MATRDNSGSEVAWTELETSESYIQGREAKVVVVPEYDVGIDRQYIKVVQERLPSDSRTATI